MERLRCEGGVRVDVQGIEVGWWGSFIGIVVVDVGLLCAVGG